ncbi:hypothetical protein [Sulfurirhabdus autotrophica]|uniref:Uncharacterized protein n=1 Tax=Sulfurirhabdus autotrophica TaxID=1706046 RepID=A0A4V2W2C5_9PROT|nr:hypothetical protein [Sulfurirhabdus autotrophica]TCV87489.1 hypothetical protein EDC63_105158 [Sulfurirhabdus autotrophica]
MSGNTESRLHHAPEVWLSNMPVLDDYLVIRINRKLLIAMAASLLLHLMFYLFFHFQKPIDINSINAGSNVLTVQLNPIVSSKKTTTQPDTPPASHSTQVQAQRHQTKPLVSAKPAKRIPPTLTVKPDIVANPIKPVAPPSNKTAEEEPTDMASFVKAARARRQLAELGNGDTAQPSEEDIRNANISRNLQQQGGGGIFQIMRVGTRSAVFSFRGWDSNYNNGRREEIEVQADANTDVEHAIIRKMITIIRQRHKGNFNWESQRLNRVITLSALVEDNAGLEDFMLREFFRAGLRPSDQ